MAENCSAALLRDIHSLSWQSADTYAFAQAIQSLHQSGQGASLGGTVVIDGAPIRLNGQYLKKVTDLFMKQTGVAWTSQRSLELVSSTLSVNAVQAYRDCLNSQKDGPQVLAYDAGPDRVFIEIRWTNPPKAPNKVDDGEIAIAGGTPDSPFPKQWTSGDRHIRRISREKGKDLDVVANIGGAADHVTVPFIPHIKVTRTRHPVTRPEPDKPPYRLAGDATGRTQGPINNSEGVAGDWIIDPTTARIDIEAFAGKIDQRTYAKIMTATEEYVQWQAQLYPLAKEGGGDIQFRVKFDAYEWKFEQI